MHNQFAEEMALDSALIPLPHQPDDVFEPANDRGETDLNLHLHDMQAEPDASKDPYAGGAR